MEELLSSLWLLGYTTLFLSIIYKFFIWNFDYFLEQGISGPKPIPIFGTSWNIWNKKWHEVEVQRYQKFGKIYGTFDGRTPNVVIGDTRLCRRILVTDFESFKDRRTIAPNEVYLGRMLATQKGRQKWRELRNILNPVFNAETLKRITELVDENGMELVSVLTQKVDTGAKKMDMQKICTMFSLDIIANCVFGMKLDCLRNPDSEFMKNAMALFNNDKTRSVRFIFAQLLYPSLIKFLPNSVSNGFDYFEYLAKKALTERKNLYISNPKDKKRGDFLDILLEASETPNSILRDERFLIAQIIQFLVAGIEPTATTLACAINSLVLDQNVQEKLRQEIKTITEHGVVKDSEIINLPYLHQCVLESLRLFNVAVKTERRCTTTTNYDGVKIRKGTTVSIPIYAIHHDAEYFPDPEKFNPDRFSAAERDDMDPMAFIPFGKGNRNCVASQFALQQIKVGLVHLIKEFQFIRVFETSDPPYFLPGGFPMLRPITVIVGIEKVK